MLLLWMPTSARSRRHTDMHSTRTARNQPVGIVYPFFSFSHRLKREENNQVRRSSWCSSSPLRFRARPVAAKTRTRVFIRAFIIYYFSHEIGVRRYQSSVREPRKLLSSPFYNQPPPLPPLLYYYINKKYFLFFLVRFSPSFRTTRGTSK